MISSQNRDYINKKLNPILESMVTDILLEKPENIIDFMSDWIKNQGQQYKDGNYLPVPSAVTQIKSNKNVVSSSEDEDQDYLEDEPKPKIGKKNHRQSVSAEAYGTWNKKGNYNPKVVPKNEAQFNRIRDRLSQAFMFSQLDEKERNIVINAMEEKRYEAGDYVIKQGEDGDNLYIVDSGELDCFKKFSGSTENTYLKTYQPGESFGELALLYNAPRAATIQAKTECVCFGLDRECFNNIVKDAAMRKRDKYEKFLSKVELLDTMDSYEKIKLADALKSVKYQAGDHIVKQGEQGETFYIIEEGQAQVLKSVQPGKKAEVVLEYKSGDYFGELALIKEIPRQATVVAKNELSAVCLDRASFKRLLGPLEEILKRNMSKYRNLNLKP